jgi:hypothetical protein
MKVVCEVKARNSTMHHHHRDGKTRGIKTGSQSIIIMHLSTLITTLITSEIRVSRVISQQAARIS